MAAGAYRIWTAKADGRALDPPTGADPEPNRYPHPNDPRAVDIYFGLPGEAPPKDQLDLQGEIEDVLDTARRLYLDAEPKREERFRRCYVRLFQLAQLGLEIANPPTDLARGAVKEVVRDLIDDEAGHVKNGHLRVLGLEVLKFSAAFVYAYLVLRLLPEPLARFLDEHLDIDRAVASNFMLLWVGCFVGVWLSYGIRTVTFTLADLTSTDSDHLQPRFRLLFAGTLTMLLGLLFSLGIVEIQIGSYPLSGIRSRPELAFLVGAFWGISEAALPGTVAQRASAFVAGIK